MLTGCRNNFPSRQRGQRHPNEDDKYPRDFLSSLISLFYFILAAKVGYNSGIML
jgi:hypothetical protein